MLRKKLLFLISVICLSVVGLSGCKEKEVPVNFGLYNQETKVDYISDKLKDKYGERFVVGTVSKLDESTAGEYGSYHAVAGRGNEICQYDVWVSEDGKMLDTLFLMDIEPKITKWVKEKLVDIDFPPEGYYIATYLNFKSCPNDPDLGKWSVEELLNSDFTELCVYVSATDGLTEDMIKAISDALDVNGGVIVQGRNAGSRIMEAVFEFSIGAELNEAIIQRVVSEKPDFSVSK